MHVSMCVTKTIHIQGKSPNDEIVFSFFKMGTSSKGKNSLTFKSGLLLNERICSKRGGGGGGGILSFKRCPHFEKGRYF